MKFNFSKRLKPVFLASALTLSGMGTMAFANDETVSNSTSNDGKQTVELQFSKCDDKEKSEKPVYKKSFAELLKDKKGNHSQAWELYEFYQEREVRLEGLIDKKTVDRLITEISILDKLQPGKQITLRINSLGGYVDDGLRLYNAIKTSKSPVHTHVDGVAASMAAIILDSSNQQKDDLDISHDQLARIVKGIVWRDEHFSGVSLIDIAERYNHGKNYVQRCIQDSFDFLSQ